jgi:hypothetical protein
MLEPGSAGGPVFDASNGYYVGVVSLSTKGAKGAYDAVGPATIQTFLKKSGLDISTMEYTAK